MSERTALPIGSVVLVREGVEPVMIVNHVQLLKRTASKVFLILERSVFH